MRGSRIGKDRWHSHCRRQGAPTDPWQHEVSFIGVFFESLEYEGWTLPPLPSYGPQWGGKGKKGKDWWALEPYPCKGGWKGGGKEKGGGKKGGGGEEAGLAPGEEVLKIFAGGIPFTASEEDMREYFSSFGEVVDAELKAFPMTGKHRGFGFVTFAKTEVAQAVLDSYDNNMIQGKWIECKAASLQAPSARKGGGYRGGGGGGGGGKSDKFKEPWTEADITEKIYLGGLPDGSTEPEVRLYCEQYGKTREVALKYNSECQFRGFAFVTFETVDSAKALLNDLENAIIGDKKIEARPSRSGENFHSHKKQKEEPIDDTEPTPIISEVIRVGGLLPEPKQRDVFKLFYNFSTTRIRDCGGDSVYVAFTSPAEAESAYRAKKDALLGGVKVYLYPATDEEFAQAAVKMHSLLPKALQDKIGAPPQVDGGGKGGDQPPNWPALQDDDSGWSKGGGGGKSKGGGWYDGGGKSSWGGGW